MLSRFLGAVIGGGHGGEGAGDAVTMVGMMAPSPGVPEGEGKALNGMVWVAAGLIGEGRDHTVSNVLGAIGGRRLMLMRMLKQMLMLMLAARGVVAWCAKVRVLMLTLLMLMLMLILLC